jgi:hypothetical protein
VRVFFAAYFQGPLPQLGPEQHAHRVPSPHDSPWCLSDYLIRREFVSSRVYYYGYNVNELAAVDYLLENYPEWRKTYDLFNNHEAAMNIVARDLSTTCGLTVYADSIWVDGGCIGLGFVFMEKSVGAIVRTPEDDERLMRLQDNLVELGLVTTKFERLCSCACLPHLEESFYMRLRSPLREKILRRAKYWKEQHERGSQIKRKSERKARRSEGKGAKTR